MQHLGLPFSRHEDLCLVYTYRVYAHHKTHAAHRRPNTGRRPSHPRRSHQMTRRCLARVVFRRGYARLTLDSWKAVAGGSQFIWPQMFVFFFPEGSIQFGGVSEFCLGQLLPELAGLPQTLQFHRHSSPSFTTVACRSCCNRLHSFCQQGSTSLVSTEGATIQIQPGE